MFQLEEEVKLALDMDVMEQEEALESAGSGRRTSRKNRNKVRRDLPNKTTAKSVATKKNH